MLPTSQEKARGIVIGRGKEPIICVAGSSSEGNRSASMAFYPQLAQNQITVSIVDQES
jgi:phosphoribulokinase